VFDDLPAQSRQHLEAEMFMQNQFLVTESDSRNAVVTLRKLAQGEMWTHIEQGQPICATA
tara:strand:- start:7825 stop:8004 length:180 start_codon:yes stop_codon:yes gene_type:complete